MDKNLLDRAFRTAIRMAEDRGLSLDQDALMSALRSVAGEHNVHDEPEEIAEDAIELLGESLASPSKRPGRRPF